MLELKMCVEYKKATGNSNKTLSDCTNKFVKNHIE